MSPRSPLYLHNQGLRNSRRSPPQSPYNPPRNPYSPLRPRSQRPQSLHCNLHLHPRSQSLRNSRLSPFRIPQSRLSRHSPLRHQP